MEGEVGCGCTISSQVIHFEKERRKLKQQLEQLRQRGDAASGEEKEQLLQQCKELEQRLEEAQQHKDTFKQRFHKYIEDTGYVPPE